MQFFLFPSLGETRQTGQTTGTTLFTRKHAAAWKQEVPE